MPDQIINVSPNRLDDGSFEVTLRHIPSRFQKFIGKEAEITTYKGYGRDWYQLPKFSPAPQKVAKLLKAVTVNPEFRHIQHHYRRKQRANA
ncbi:hypothetical protein [Pleionea sp. CnH1-48]|uniref:hypothetical protein n=1 Tax=Pleionea sp. CnH1-48 TaxID=2954494 RepID=UPI0020985F7A|nr:hypothetical protein [Pleionea sp. CnH1-48]MCO7222678.1 hypothetical protein [Pleionea sp. CnH1-48]